MYNNAELKVKTHINTSWQEIKYYNKIIKLAPTVNIHCTYKKKIINQHIPLAFFGSTKPINKINLSGGKQQKYGYIHAQMNDHMKNVLTH